MENKRLETAPSAVTQCPDEVGWHESALSRALLTMYGMGNMTPSWMRHVLSPLVLGPLFWLFVVWRRLPMVFLALCAAYYLFFVPFYLGWWILEWQVSRRVRALGPKQIARLVQELGLTPNTSEDKLASLAPQVFEAMWKLRETNPSCWIPKAYDLEV